MRHSLFISPLLIVLYSIFLGPHKVLVAGQCSNDQKTLLLDLKNSLIFNDALSTKLVTWVQNSGSWVGVECKNGQVVGLDLSSESITGFNGSSNLFQLQYLEKLNLAYNRFNSSAIPSGFGNLGNLVNLNLSNCNFNGQVPAEISRLTRLQVLDLSTSSFLGLNSSKLENPNLKMLVENFKELKELYLDGVNISASGVQWCNALSSSPLENLQVLSMSGCLLTGPIDSSLLRLRSLSVIQLSNNNLSSVPDFFANFSNLTVLRLANSGLEGNFPSKIFQLTSLKTLDLSANINLQGSLPEFPENSSLQTLVLSHTNFSGRLPNSIGNLTDLSRIELVNCSFNGSIPNTMEDLSQLVFLDFSSNSFVGPIPSFNLSRNLTQIILPHNSLTGPITSTHWEKLKNLVNIDMQNNSLNGSIPMSLFKLPLIQKIQLANNQFSGDLNGTLANSSSALDTIDLSANNLDGPISSFFVLKGLKFLSLSFNNFSGSFHMQDLQQLNNLSNLDLSHNNLVINSTGSGVLSSQFTTFRLASCQLRAFPDFLESQTKLMNLDLSGNHINGSIPHWIWGLKSLQYLNLSSNSLYMDSSPPIINITSLSILDVHSNRLEGEILPLPPLATYLDYSDNRFNFVIPDNIADKLAVTIFFSLSKNNLMGSIPDSICRTEYLQVLDLSDNNLTGFIPSCLVNTTSLKVLNLRNNSLQGSIPDIPAGLKTLDLNGNWLEGELPESLGNCTSLEVLDVGNNKLNGTFPCQLKGIPTLRVLVLRSNKFGEKIGCPKVIGVWKMLQIIDISSNSFTGKLPAKYLTNWEAMKTHADLNHLQYPYLGLTRLYYQDTVSVTIKGFEIELVKILTVFTAVDISCNNFTGPIPKEVGELRALYFLNMSRNELSGSIPAALGNLQQLESLDLSHNKLNGTIPKQLSELTFLSLLNLSFNQLEGQIPEGNQFLTFSEDSYLGNPRLCGQPLQRKCSAYTPIPTPGKNTNRTRAKKHGFALGGFNWELITVGLGFGAGAAMVVAPLTFCSRGREWYDDLVDKILLVFLPLVGLSYTTWREREIEVEGTLEETSDSEEEDDCLEKEEEESWGRYCVFCSKIDIVRKIVVHDPRCTCYDSPTISSSSSFASSSS